MYHYVINPSSGNGQFADISHRLKARLRELDIDGEFAKTLEEGDARKITRSFLQRGATTIVVAGGDRTVNEVITTVNAAGKHSVAIGILPLGKSNIIANYLDIRDWQHGCEALAARRLRTLNVIHINDHTFIHSCRITPTRDTTDAATVLAEVDGQYKIRGNIWETLVRNQKLESTDTGDRLSVRFEHAPEPSGRWERWLRPRSQSPSQLPARVLVMEFEQPHVATVDGRSLTDDMFRIRLAQTPIKLIAGKPPSQGFDT